MEGEREGAAFTPMAKAQGLSACFFGKRSKRNRWNHNY